MSATRPNNFTSMPQVVVQLLDSRSPSVLLFAGLAAHHLASVPELKEPLGQAGAVEALVGAVRRWIDSSSSDQREGVRALEWVMAALTGLMQVRRGGHTEQHTVLSVNCEVLPFFCFVAYLPCPFSP